MAFQKGDKKCAYRHGEGRCNKWAFKGSEFCTDHSLPNMGAEQMAEANAFGPETAKAMREELGVEERPSQTTRPVRSPIPSQPIREEPEISEEQRQNPVAYAMKMALDEVARAYREDNEERANSRNIGQRQSPTDRARTTLAAYMPEFDDPAAMVGSHGQKLVRPGWIPRWVRDKDEDGRPNSRRLRTFYAQGAEDVLDEDGRPLVGRLGRAIQMPPEVYAARVLKYSSTGAFDSNPYVQNAFDAAEATNRQAGRKVVDIRPSSEHGSRRGDW